MSRFGANLSAAWALWHAVRRHKVYRWGWSVHDGRVRPIYKCFTCRGAVR